MKPVKRASLVLHGEQGWYIEPATNHYMLVSCYIPKTHRERITYTAKIILKHIPIPQASYEDHIRWLAEYLFQLLKHK